MNLELENHTAFLQTFLLWLETDVVMTPSIRDQSNIHVALQMLFDRTYHVPMEIATAAQRIYEHFQEDQWGADEGVGSDSDMDEPTTPMVSPTLGQATTLRATLQDNDMYTSARSPPVGHPIWGRRGIMHGFVIKPARRFGHVFNPRYKHDKRSFKEFGHNGLEPGAWWPYLKVALFHGAHGHSVAGISGHPDLGAWSVVVSGGKYEEMDSDKGDVIWYSSDDNTDPNRVICTSNKSLSLHKSFVNRRPVRVLRSSGKSAFAPSVGIRYDGLYSVASVRTRKNPKGGLYEQFQLTRLTNQRPLSDICLSVPTGQQQADFNRIKEGY